MNTDTNKFQGVPKGLPMDATHTAEGYPIFRVGEVLNIRGAAFAIESIGDRMVLAPAGKATAHAGRMQRLRKRGRR